MNYRSYKYRIYPTPDQRVKIDQSIGVCRMVYNLALETKKYVYRAYGINLSAFDLIKQVYDLKKDYSWVADIDSQAINASILNLEKAYKNFFKGKGFPKFKSKHKGVQSFRCPFNTRKIDWVKSTLSVPKLYNIPIVLSRRFEGEIKTVTISKTPTNKYFASILVETLEQLPTKLPINKAIGIDLGLTHFLTTDSGLKIDNPHHLRENMNRLKGLQYRASKKKKGSNNRKKANLRVARLFEKITNKRLDFIHKVTSGLVNDSQVDTFVMEDMNVKGMISNHHLAQAISDVSWSKFKEILKYKCDWHGKNLLFINRFAPSSKKCSACDHVKEELSLSDRTYHCEYCGHVMDRDMNAAINIKNFGLSAVGSRVEPVEMSTLKSTKQEINA